MGALSEAPRGICDPQQLHITTLLPACSLEKGEAFKCQETRIQVNFGVTIIIFPCLWEDSSLSVFYVIAMHHLISKITVIPRGIL